jgi:hypothetical protein
VQGFLDDFEAQTSDLEQYFPRADAKALFMEAMDAYNRDFLPAVEKVLTDAENGVEQTELIAYMVSNIKPAVDLASGNLTQCMDIKSEMLDTTSKVGTELADRLFIILPALIAASVIISVILSL